MVVHCVVGALCNGSLCGGYAVVGTLYGGYTVVDERSKPSCLFVALLLANEVPNISLCPGK